MSEIPKAYEPQSVESRRYEFWVSQGCFTADPGRVSERRPAYSIVIPPPNVTGVLTLGHVLNNTIQDILARKARMDGKEVLWLPGTDHAGIATQNVVEKTLRKEGVIKHRDDLGRDALVARIWQWKETYGGIILEQLRALGASCDWSRTRFTMDPEYSSCVRRVFVDLYRKGLIYRGKRMVNWCPASQTALSDEEVVMKEQKGHLYYFRVEVVERPGTFLTIATTRPETIPADTAVAVSPKDPRYADLVGLHVRRALPLENQAVIPILADDHIDPEFGTGVLKVTPAHDRTDFDIGQRHGLPIIDVLTPDGHLTAEAGKDLAGLDRFAGRKRAAEILEAAGSLEKTEPYTNNVGFSERADVPIEPRLSEQWFLTYPAVEASRACVEPPLDKGTGSGSDADLDRSAHRPSTIRFHPDRWARVYDHWMGNLKDWCISRQVWWGHRIPVWRKTLPPGAGDPIAEVIANGRVASARPAAGEPCREGSVSGQPKERSFGRVRQVADGSTIVEVATDSEVESEILQRAGYEQDPDVLDTWFSSWLWPFATMGWTGDPEKDARNATLRTFYPTTDLVTGPDIIFFWVARMIMAGHEYLGDLPFRNVYYTGIIRDKQGRKMSKSLGNSPDPLDLIRRFGADALRFGVMRSAPLGQDVIYDEQNVELGRNFCNKLWNACRFRQMQGGEVQGEIDPALLSSDDRWILLRLDQAIREVDLAYANYRFVDVTQTLYRFFWSEYCDWYIEASKAALPFNPPPETADNRASAPEGGEGAANRADARRANTLAVIDFVLGHMLRMFHPFLPFITEELWHGLGYAEDMPPDQGGRTILFAPWPKPFSDEEKEAFGLDADAGALADAKYELVTLARNLKAQFNLPANKKLRFVFRPAGPLPAAETDVLRLLLNAETLEMVPADWTPEKGTPMASNALGQLFLPLAGVVDAGAERARLGKELDRIRGEIAKVREKLDNPNFTGKVPAKVLEEHRQRLVDWQDRESRTLSALANLPGSP